MHFVLWASAETNIMRRKKNSGGGIFALSSVAEALESCLRRPPVLVHFNLEDFFEEIKINRKCRKVKNKK
jgi:hypothetical protein